MSYGGAAALQVAIYQALTGDTVLSGLVSGAIYDSAPSGPVAGTYVSLGPEDVRDRSDCTANGAVHVLTVSVVSDAAGFQTAKTVAGAVSDVLIDASLELTRGTLVALRFLRATARRGRSGETRRIDLKFQAHVDDA